MNALHSHQPGFDVMVHNGNNFIPSATILMKTIKEWTKEELLALPNRPAQNKEQEYSSILVLSRSDPGSSNVETTAVIGVVKGKPIELAATHSEFVDWHVEVTMPAARNLLARERTIRSVALIQSSAFHVWMPGARVKVAVLPNQTHISFVLNIDPDQL